ncbi:dipeptide/oligopeptide/nickel ABC transporter permease/ATP-binding protein [Natronosporangium hydrolyticum]|uniref:Dipeptide/oligopeptide/nickel ABC transporter permease/ATP-binding protein n=1 Tax=Natronosporangium hydrolyticum TaxID=2811111 RepID=A0A895YGQ8_9ACTN|nr:dipeptide/oligopeptide/nickel ABC transporter permease/ATP-binding protein [Natronosporangium hydrolyticum]QSB12878.1 dipeptide/oligopeptide/nickel ABC transporter permease/ATP-binding protein [Natronosporangium hydrolyticum]
MSSADPSVVNPPAAAPIVRGSLLRRLVGNPTAVIALGFLAVVAVVAVLGARLAPYDPNHASLQRILRSPGGEHLLGTDGSGRDVFSRLLAATQISVAAALLALGVALVLGVAGGLLAGYYGGWFDTVSSWLTSLIMALPGIVILLAARAVVGPSVWMAMAIFGVLLSPAFFRLVYAAVTAVRNELYVDAARVSGLSDARIIGRHILVVVRAPIIIQSAIVTGIAIAIQSGLEFLGLGDLSVPTWGSMLNEGFQNIYREPMLMLWPSLAIGLTTIALALLANAMRDALERVGVRPQRRRSPAATAAPAAAATPVAAGEAPVAHPADPAEREPGTPPLLRITGLRIGYDQPDGSVVEVLHGIDLEVGRGEVHGLVGESGSGKTQTAFGVLGLLSDGGRVLDGSIQLDGVELAGAGEREYVRVRGRTIAYVPQEPMSNLDPGFTIGSQLVEPLRVTLGMSKRAATAHALELLHRVGIPEPRRTFAAYAHEISGGMAQRVLIAGAVATDPQLLIADEPTTALDVTVQAEVLDLLRDLQAERQMAMLLVTHNFGVVADLCDQVSVMQAGQIVETGPVRAIFHEAAHPYTSSLLAAILDGGEARGPLAATDPKDGAR